MEMVVAAVVALCMTWWYGDRGRVERAATRSTRKDQPPVRTKPAKHAQLSPDPIKPQSVYTIGRQGIIPDFFTARPFPASSRTTVPVNQPDSATRLVMKPEADTATAPPTGTKSAGQTQVLSPQYPHSECSSLSGTFVAFHHLFPHSAGIGYEAS